MSYIVFYKLDKKYYCYDGSKCIVTDKIHTIKANQFEMHHSYDKTEQSLKSYYDNMKIWSEQIQSKFNKCKFDYLSKHNDMIATEHFCKMYIKKFLDSFDTITFTEQKWIEKCNNSGLQVYKPTNGAVKVYSYDGKGFYQFVLSLEEFLIPDKEGYETTLDKLPKKKDLKHGYYHIKITSDNPDAKMVFSFNSDNVYYYYDLYFALQHKETLSFNFELVQDNEPNAYLYNSVVKSSDIFSKWSKTINELKKEYPDNKLLKNLGSKVWGKLCEFNEFIVEDEELQKNLEKYNDCEIIRTKKYGEFGTPDYREIHYLQDPEKPYKNSIRIKSQITSFTRQYICNIAIKDIDNLVRVHTDCISFNKAVKMPDRNIMKKEDKSSGLIQIYSCNKLRHECWRCKEQFQYADYLNHKCT